MGRHIQSSEFCCATRGSRCACACRWPRGAWVVKRQVRAFRGPGPLVSSLDFSRCADGRYQKKHDIANLRYSVEGTCAVTAPQKSTPLNSEMLGISRPDRERPPSFVAHHAPQKFTEIASFVGKPRSQRARRQNSPFFRSPNRERTPQKWSFRFQSPNFRLLRRETRNEVSVNHESHEGCRTQNAKCTM